MSINILKRIGANISLSPFKLVNRPNLNVSSKCHAKNSQITCGQCPDKNKVVVVIGATGTGKSRLSIELASQFNGEVVNSDCMQVYKGLDIVTNKVSDEERHNVTHHLLGFMDPFVEFTSSDFVHNASQAIKDITINKKLPIIAGGSNSYIKALVVDNLEFPSIYQCCFFWVDVSMSVLHSRVSKRVDEMVEAGMVEEGRKFFEPSGDYTRGIRRSIGVPEMHEYYKNEDAVDEYTKNILMERAIGEIKVNTRGLTCRQVQNILNLEKLLMWKVHRLNATDVFLAHGMESDQAWKRMVFDPSVEILERFL